MNRFDYIAEKIDGGYLVHVNNGDTAFLTPVEFEKFKTGQDKLKKNNGGVAHLD